MGGSIPYDEGVYAISVAAVMAGTAQQNLRVYERKGLLTPARTAGGTRQYSQENIDTLRRIGELLEAGLNLAGIRMVLELEADNAELEADNARLRRLHGKSAD